MALQCVRMDVHTRCVMLGRARFGDLMCQRLCEGWFDCEHALSLPEANVMGSGVSVHWPKARYIKTSVSAQYLIAISCTVTYSNSSPPTEACMQAHASAGQAVREGQRFMTLIVDALTLHGTSTGAGAAHCRKISNSCAGLQAAIRPSPWHLCTVMYNIITCWP